MATKSLYVGNLPYGTTEDELRELFAEWGPVASVRLIADKGFAFVDVPEERAAEAIAGANNRDLKGRALRVDEARPRPPREGGRRGGFGTGGGGPRRGPGGGRNRGPRW
jgi:RNA recognition motif-containing protein